MEAMFLLHPQSFVPSRYIEKDKQSRVRNQNQ
jgi:hypothetical protein